DLLPGLFRLMQAVGDHGMGVFVEHGVSFVRLLPGGPGGTPGDVTELLSPAPATNPPHKKKKKKKK
ncbi:hypothetical protein, partial [Enterobacter intestinihominis]